MAKKYTKHRKYKKINKRRTMKGGVDPIPQNVDDVHDLDLNEGDSLDLSDSPPMSPNVSSSPSRFSFLNRFNGSSSPFRLPSFLNRSNSSNASNASNASNDSNGSLRLSDLNTSNGSLRLSDLNASDSGNTTDPDESDVFGPLDDEMYGGKRSKKVKTSKNKGKKGKKGKKSTRKQRGGTCYGNGVGANNYDPNYSIYNTNLLKLFPYKAN